ncbi:retrovirus-related pol polyprotein from transposon TNT 1-94 [Tanacetum coccineum]|uniref:Retrovirus-related pol polyprotein from transposon TNT 1-94 n=1 Tax=Tanacetum coccineum TaxID=301880 RepID=A0ABQ5FZU5_9ASTR
MGLSLEGISHNFSSPYTPEQNGVAKRKNRTLIEAARTMLNGSVLSKHFWTKAFRTACFIQNRSIIVKRHDKTPYEIFRERIPDINYFHVFGCPVFIHNHKDHLGKFDAKADDGYFLGYPFVSKLLEQYQANSDISYYVIPHGCSLTELTQENHVPEAITPNEHVTPHTEDVEGPSGQNIGVSVSINESSVLDIPQSIISNQASTSSHHVDAMQEELNQFYRNKVWTLVPLPYEKTDIGSKWVFRNKKDEHVARMEAIRIFLSFATYMTFTTFQIDVKSAFLNGKLKEEVYVKQHIGFESSEFPDYACKLDKALNGLKQALRAWYMYMTSYLAQQAINFVNSFKLMTKKFEISMMGELTYFLGLQIKQDDKGISICQEQYTRNLLKKYEISDSS